MTIRVGINGFGRMGRLALRAAWGFDPAWRESLNQPSGVWGAGNIEIVHVNEIKGGADTAAHLFVFDSVHGRWPVSVDAEGAALRVGGERLTFSEHGAPDDVPWRDLGVDIVLECSGKFRTPETLQPYFDAGVAKVIVAAPVKDAARRRGDVTAEPYAAFGCISRALDSIAGSRDATRSSSRLVATPG